MTPEVVSIVSKKNSGKTTLLEKLIAELTRRGYRIGIIKHDLHGFQIDHEGKDSYRHKAAGARTVAVSCPWMLAVIKDVEEEVPLDRIVAEYFSDMDLVITEGYKRGGKPQIEVYRRAAHEAPLHIKGKEGTLIAMATDTSVDIGVPCFDVNDVDGIADFIERMFLSKT